MALTENVGGSGAFKPTTLGTSKSYVLSASTSPLVLAPPSDKVIRLDFFGLNDTGDLGNTSISVGVDLMVNGILSAVGTGAGRFMVGRSSFSNVSSNFAYPASYKEAITANEPDQSITIETTDTTPRTVFYSVSYGDLV